MRSFLCCCLLTVSAASWGQTRAMSLLPARQEEGKARKLLEASMARLPVLNVRVIITQTFGYSSNSMQQIKVEMSKDGKLHQVVLAPLSYQGTELVDDGHQTLTYTPDDHCVTEQPSGRFEVDDIKFRMGLVDRNYNLRINRRERIAGRNAVVVEAVAKNDDIPNRCYAIDEKTGFLLRLETCKDGEAPVLHFDTKMVEFPTSFAPNTFHLEASMGTKVKHFDRKCVSPQAKNNLREELGFRPVIPTNLPYGFAAQELQASTDTNTPAVIIRITDGLAKANVLEWRRVGPTRGATPEGTLVRHSGSLTILVSGDLPDEVKERIISSFVKAAKSEGALGIPVTALSWVQELGCDVNVFSINRDREDWMPLVRALSMAIRI